MPCPAAHQTEPRRCWAINPTDSNGWRTHARRFTICQTVARPSTALRHVHSLSKTQHTDRRQSKKDPRPVRSRLGPDRSRTGNWTSSNSNYYYYYYYFIFFIFFIFLLFFLNFTLGSKDYYYYYYYYQICNLLCLSGGWRY